jgi:hypothetical protein
VTRNGKSICGLPVLSQPFEADAGRVPPKPAPNAPDGATGCNTMATKIGLYWIRADPGA